MFHMDFEYKWFTIRIAFLSLSLFLSHIRDTVSSAVGSKELFEPCVTAVKSFLAGEPFSEFESSMYFHR